jgi:hypothetical protein
MTLDLVPQRGSRTQPGVSTRFQPQEPSTPATRPHKEHGGITRDCARKARSIRPVSLLKTETMFAPLKYGNHALLLCFQAYRRCTPSGCDAGGEVPWVSTP